MRLEPFDGADRVQLPDGTECWERETKHFGGSETILSYRYSVDVTAFSKDYWGRVEGVKVRASDGSWNEPTTYFPATPDLINRVLAILEAGWADLSVVVRGNRLMGASNYLKISNDVLALLETMKR